MRGIQRRVECGALTHVRWLGGVALLRIFFPLTASECTMPRHCERAVLCPTHAASLWRCRGQRDEERPRAHDGWSGPRPCFGWRGEPGLSCMLVCCKAAHEAGSSDDQLHPSITLAMRVLSLPAERARDPGQDQLAAVVTGVTGHVLSSSASGQAAFQPV
jgi:hypothetical protein